MEGGLMHLLHAFIIAIVLYLIMRYLLKQSNAMSINRSIIIGALAVIYMILFGHGMPTHINRI